MYQSLQACRAAAAALVVLFHLGGTFAQDKYFGFKALDLPFAWADAGVEFFFVLSGFLIATVHRHDIGRPAALGGYFWKRALRIYPTYWLIGAAVCLAALAVPALRESVPSDPWILLKAFALIPQDPAVVGGTGSPILFVAWSLQYEMLFYAVIAVFIASRGAGVLVIAALAGAHLACRFGSSCGFPLSFLGSNLVLLFALGVGTAWACRSRLALPAPALVAAVAVLGFVGFGAYEVVHGRDSIAGVDRRLVYGFCSVFIIAGLVRAQDAGRLAGTRPVVGLLGDASYALYLLHIPIISVLCKLGVRLGVASPAAVVALFAGIFVACVAASVAFYWVVERPLLRRFRSGFARPVGRTTTGPGRVRLQ